VGETGESIKAVKLAVSQQVVDNLDGY